MVEAKDSALTSGTPMENDSIKISTRFGSVERPRSTNHAPNGSVTSATQGNMLAYMAIQGQHALYHASVKFRYPITSRS